MKIRPKPGTTGWIATTAVIIAAELLDEKTMSTGFRNYSRDPVGRYVMLPAWAYLTAHLFGVIPVKYDPLSLLWVWAKGAEIALDALPDAALQSLVEEAA